jgi:hypothetical protein
VERRWLDELAGRNHADTQMHALSQDPGRIFELKPGADLVRDGWSLGLVNSWGCRGPERPAARPDGAFRLLALGGSNTYGPGVTAGATWPGQLERRLHDALERPIEVWSCGVSAYNAQQKVAFARALLAEVEVDALLVQVHNLGPRTVPSGADVRPILEAQPDVLADWAPALADRRGLAGPLLRSPLRLVTLPVLLHARRNAFLAEDKRPADDLLLSTWRSGLAELGELAGERPLLLVVPPPGLSRETRPFREALGTAGLPVLDLSREALPDLDAIRHIHPGYEEYAWYGETLARMLLAAHCPADGANDGPCLPGLAER